MVRDPLLRHIQQRLTEDIDCHLFELCAQALLREVYPSLSPVVGGKDGGFDGAVGSSDGAFPLICTVSSAVVDNVRKNLKTHLTKDLGPPRAVVATSKVLSPPTHTKIRELGRELGVTIVNVHDGTWFATALYRDAGWRRDLLGLTGNPPVLSAFPLNARLWADGERYVARILPRRSRS